MLLVAAHVVLLGTIGVNPPNWTLNSDWQTNYVDYTGKVQSAPIKLRNGAGQYGPRGQLLNTCFFPSVIHPRGDTSSALVGEWRMNGKRGYFVFRAPDANSHMDGYWGEFDANGFASQIIGSWDGKLTKVLPAANIVSIPQPKVQQPTKLDVSPLPDFSVLPKAEAQFGDNSKLYGLKWVDTLNDRKLLVGSLTLAEGMPVTVDGEQKYYPADEQCGTCFLIGKGVGLTARHCVSVVSKPGKLKATFVHPKGTAEETHALLEEPINLTNVDVSLLLFDPGSGSWPDRYISVREALDRNGNLGAPQTQTPLIVQFPRKQGWQMSFQGAFVNVKPADQYVHYTATTAKGSSGAPVFGSDWQLMAVHTGELVNSNVGVRIDLVVSELRRALKDHPKHSDVLKRIGL